MTTYNYPKLIEESSALMPVLVGKTLISSVLINVVEPEFNVVYLNLDNEYFSIQGEIGGEYLGIHRLTELPEITDQDGYIISAYEPYDIFIGRKVLQIRQVGEAWNGHGYELSFEGIPNTTMIIQSMDVKGCPDDLVDCLRIGFGNYQLTYEK
jgi:hypothetical protein